MCTQDASADEDSKPGQGPTGPVELLDSSCRLPTIVQETVTIEQEDDILSRRTHLW